VPKKNKFSLYAIIIVALFYVASFHIYKPWQGGIIGGGDTWGYYLYLPALFIHGDLDNLEKSLESRKKYHPGYYSAHQEKNPLGIGEAHLSPIGRKVNKYTIGMAILYAPFFFMAHLYSKIFGITADGYSFIYIYLVHLSSVIYIMIGLFFLRKVLLKFFDDRVSLISIAIIALATNLYYFCVLNSPMAHPYLFFLYCMLLFFSKGWHENYQTKYAIGIGLSLGFITLIRPTEIIAVFIPLLWGVSFFKGFKERAFLLAEKKKSLLFAFGAAFLVMLPQLIYWKYTTGSFLYYSYSDEGFNFLKPNLYWGIFQFKNGWLAYTPAMIFSLLGILFSFRRRREFLMPILFFLPIHIYITYSWWCWNYINGFGSRPMIETYALLSLPLAVFTQEILNRKWWIYLYAPLVTFFIWLNVFNTYQFSLGILWSEDANWNYYKTVFGKTSINKSDLVVYDSGEMQPDVSNLKFSERIYVNTFEDSTSEYYDSFSAFKGEYSFTFNNELEFGPGFKVKLDTINANAGDWLKASVYCMRKYEGNDIYRMSSLVVKVGDKKWRHVRLDNKPGNTINSLWGGKSNVWEKVDLWVQIPESINGNEIVESFIWNRNHNKIYIDEFVVEVWKPRGYLAK
jgi:hypothetical protein